MKQLGYSATYHSIQNNSEGWPRFLAWEQLSREMNLPVAAYYSVLQIGVSPADGSHTLEEIIEALPAGSVLELAVTKSDATPSDHTLDDRVVAALTPYLVQAARRKITLSLYHHLWFLLERIDDCVRIAKKINHPNLRVTFCGYHWFALGGENLSAKISLAAPWLQLANVCGSRTYPPGQCSPAGLPATIEVVGAGDFPLDEFIDALAQVGFAGGIGFQGFMIEGDPEINLRHSLQNWNEAFQRV